MFYAEGLRLVALAQKVTCNYGIHQKLHVTSLMDCRNFCKNKESLLFHVEPLSYGVNCVCMPAQNLGRENCRLESSGTSNVYAVTEIPGEVATRSFQYYNYEQWYSCDGEAEEHKENKKHYAECEGECTAENWW